MLNSHISFLEDPFPSITTDFPLKPPMSIIMVVQNNTFTGHNNAKLKYAHQVAPKSLQILTKSTFDNYVHESSNQQSFEE